MKNMSMSPKQHAVLLYMRWLPKKIIELHGTDEVTDFVLYTLCNADCFDFGRAAYFVDNPDFDWCKGVAGYARDECHDLRADDTCDAHACGCACRRKPFAQKVRSCNRRTMPRDERDVGKAVADLASQVSIERPNHCMWGLKNGNRGIMIFETDNEDDPSADARQHLEYACSLLGFCPVS